MQRKMIVLVMGLFLLILGGTGVAMGADQQVVGQAADSSQSADSTATSTQDNPSNQNIDVRIFSPGDAGAVTQTNSSAAAAAAANANTTDQSAQQQQGGGAGGGQAVGQDATSTQTADADATSTQHHPSNSNIAVRIDSPGNGGPVTQTNSSAAASGAANLNDTDQSATQQHGGGACCATGGTQAVGQNAHNDQDATSEATSTQVKPSNTNIGVRIGSAGNDGAVTQTNSSAAVAAALNANETDQSATQRQGGGACCATGGTQAVGQKAHNDQDADASATSTQSGASNVNVPVRIFSPGSGGSVTQTNASVAAAKSVNLNDTDQSAVQEQGGGACCVPTLERIQPQPCCSGGTGVQAIGQLADSSQDADSSATSTQDHPSNTNTPVRIGSYGDDGAVTQTNASVAAAVAANLNATDQSATQQQAGGLGTGVQAIGQKAVNDQDADASATSTQSGASNTNAPVRIWSPGGGGSVEQTNASVALAGAVNLNKTDQTATQTQGGGGCCGLGTGVQAIGQAAWSSQEADSDADASQYGASNANTPVRIASRGDDGTVDQTNASIAAAKAANLNATDQSAEQSQAGGGCCVRTTVPERVSTPCCYGGTGVQAIGQIAYNRQDADASAESTQIAPCNVNYPVREYSPGGGGSVSQSNVSLAESLGLNANWLTQHALQQQGGTD